MRIVARVADNRPSRYEEDGRIIYRASALGSCMKSLVALGLGMTPVDWPDWLYRKFQEGIDGEPVVVDMLRENWRIVDEEEGHYYQWHDGQLFVEVPVGTRVVIRGHGDAIGTCYKTPVYEYGESEWETGDKRLIEVKCCSAEYARVVLRTLPLMYKVQVSVYGGFYGLPIMLVIGVKDKDGKVVNILSQMIDEPPMTMAQVKQRVMQIESWIGDGELPDCDYRQWPCAFPYLCDEPMYGNEATRDEDLEEMLAKSIEITEAKKRGANG